MENTHSDLFFLSRPKLRAFHVIHAETKNLLPISINANNLTLNNGTISDLAGNAANLAAATGFNPAGTLRIDTAAPTVQAIATSGTGITSGTGTVSVGGTVLLTATFSEAVTVAGGTLAVDDVNLHVDHGEYVVLLGPSGCGKTTTLRMIAGLELPSEGRIQIGRASCRERV